MHQLQQQVHWCHTLLVHLLRFFDVLQKSKKDKFPWSLQRTILKILPGKTLRSQWTNKYKYIFYITYWKVHSSFLHTVLSHYLHASAQPHQDMRMDKPVSEDQLWSFSLRVRCKWNQSLCPSSKNASLIRPSLLIEVICLCAVSVGLTMLIIPPV